MGVACSFSSAPDNSKKSTCKVCNYCFLLLDMKFVTFLSPLSLPFLKLLNDNGLTLETPALQSPYGEYFRPLSTRFLHYIFVYQFYSLARLFLAASFSERFSRR